MKPDLSNIEWLIVQHEKEDRVYIEQVLINGVGGKKQLDEDRE